MSEPTALPVEAAVPSNGPHPDIDRATEDRLERLRDETLQVTNRLEAILATLYRDRHGSSPIALVPRPEG
jgi:hypothetical protein